MQLIGGGELPISARDEVLRAFGYRWTRENAGRAAQWLGKYTPASEPAMTDGEWLATRSFWIAKNGNLMRRRGFSLR